MSTSVEWKDIMLGVGSILFAGAFTMLFKALLKKYRRPNGKKGGIISLHVTLAFAIVTVVAMITKDWFLTGLSVILAYLIGRGRLDEGQHYLYQVVLGAIIGVAIPYSMFYFYYKRFGSGGHSNHYEREEYDDKPERAHDDRHEADEHSELRLEDFDDLDFKD